MSEWGYAVAREDELRHRFLLSKLHVSKVTKKALKDGMRGSKAAMFKEMVVTDPEKLKMVHQDLVKAQEKVKALTQRESGDATNGGSIATLSGSDETGAGSVLLASSPLAGAYVRNSTSSKLNFILNEVNFQSANLRTDLADTLT